MATNRKESQKLLGEANRTIRELQSFRDNLPDFLIGYSRSVIERVCAVVWHNYDVRLLASERSADLAEVQECVRLQFDKEIEEAGLVKGKN